MFFLQVHNRSLPFKVEFMHRANFDENGRCVYLKFYAGPQAIHQDALAALSDDAVPPMVPTPVRPNGPEVETDFAKTLALFGEFLFIYVRAIGLTSCFVQHLQEKTKPLGARAPTTPQRRKR